MACLGLWHCTLPECISRGFLEQTCLYRIDVPTGMLDAFLSPSLFEGYFASPCNDGLHTLDRRTNSYAQCDAPILLGGHSVNPPQLFSSNLLFLVEGEPLTVSET